MKYGNVVLIVAKCIVNPTNLICKVDARVVLIVAKCIVNEADVGEIINCHCVLIVAKCIVNMHKDLVILIKLKY